MNRPTHYRKRNFDLYPDAKAGQCPLCDGPLWRSRQSRGGRPSVVCGHLVCRVIHKRLYTATHKAVRRAEQRNQSTQHQPKGSA